MSLGQVMLGIGGYALSREEREILRHPQVGGVILFTRNFHDVEQLQALIKEIHGLRQPRLLVAVDQEGGRVQRFQGAFTRLPPVGVLAPIYDREPQRARELAETMGWLMAAEQRAVGVDLSFAPVLDLGRGVSRVIGDRAFHARPEAVADLAQAYVRGMRRAGMAATGKHFPGHGSVAPDSHLELPRDERPWGDLQLEDLVPFERLIRAGIAAMMTAHVIYPALDAQPASFSRAWVEDVLRRRLGFQGAVFSDDLGMQAAGCIGDFPARAGAALAAGCDMVLLCNDLDQTGPVLDALPPPDPVAAMRLARLHGRPGAPAWQALRTSAAWRAAADAMRRGGPFQEPELDLE
jgi:beta-N-acetylhexosaminidase